MQALADPGDVRVVVLGRGPQKLVGREIFFALTPTSIEETWPGDPQSLNRPSPFDPKGLDPGLEVGAGVLGAAR